MRLPSLAKALESAEEESGVLGYAIGSSSEQHGFGNQPLRSVQPEQDRRRSHEVLSLFCLFVCFHGFRIESIVRSQIKS